MPEPDKSSLDIDFEHHDINLKAPVILGGLIVLLVGGASLICLWLFGFFEGRLQEREVLRYPDRPAEAPGVPNPVLNERLELEREASEILSSYGWASIEQERVRVPIERALELVVERGLPELEPGGGEEDR